MAKISNVFSKEEVKKTAHPKRITKWIHYTKLTRNEKQYCDAKNMEEMGNILNNTPGFVKAMWCGCQECEDKIKEQFAATSRCMPFEQETLSDTCVCCGKPAKKMVYWGKAY